MRPQRDVSTVAVLTAAARPSIDLQTACGRPAADVLAQLGSGEQGLTTEEAQLRRETFGANVLAEHRVTALGVLIRQLRNPLLILLLAAASISAVTGDTIDGGIIAGIVVLSVGLGFINEYRSELAVAALHANIHHDALVWRDGRQQRVDVRELVPGDMVELRVGDLIPADVRLVETNRLECDEGVLTGESMPANKSEAATQSESSVDLPSGAFMGTVVHQGSGKGIVVSTGSATAFGKIAVGLGERQAETAFQVGLRNFSKLLVRVAAVLTISIFVINVALPFTPLADDLGFAALPLSFFLILLGMIATYLVLIEIVKGRFYAVQSHPHRPRMTHEQRHQRRVARRALRFSRRSAPRPRQRVD